MGDFLNLFKMFLFSFMALSYCYFDIFRRTLAPEKMAGFLSRDRVGNFDELPPAI